jgi:hypothetical protein
VIQTDHLLRRYGPEAEGLRDLLRRHTAMKIQDLFPEGTTKLPNLRNPRTVALLEELQDRLVALDSSNANQRWLQSQALQNVSAIGARWLLVEQNTIGIAVPLLVLVVLWLTRCNFVFCPVVKFGCSRRLMSGHLLSVLDLEKEKEVLFTFFDFPAEHRSHLRTTNPIESTFATVRLRTQQTKGCVSPNS